MPFANWWCALALWQSKAEATKWLRSLLDNYSTKIAAIYRQLLTVADSCWQLLTVTDTCWYYLVLNRRSRIKMHKIVVPFFNFHIRWWVGPSTSKNHGANFPPPFSFRKIKVFDIIFEKILSPGIGPPKLWFAFYQQWSIGNWHSIPHLKDLDLRISCMCLVRILLSWMLRICK